jgi:hypothetical protein
MINKVYKAHRKAVEDLEKARYSQGLLKYEAETEQTIKLMRILKMKQSLEQSSQ